MTVRYKITKSQPQGIEIKLLNNYIKYKFIKPLVIKKKKTDTCLKFVPKNSLKIKNNWIHVFISTFEPAHWTSMTSHKLVKYTIQLNQLFCPEMQVNGCNLAS